MSQQPLVFLSNRLEHLYIHLKTQLFHNTQVPFTKRLIIVPSPAMKLWLQLQLANDPEIGIAAGVEITHLDQATELLYRHFSTKPRSRYPNHLELAFVLEQLMRNSAGGLPELDSFINLTTPKGEKRVILLADKLASLFDLYSKYGASMVARWTTSPKGWQSRLWNQAYSEMRWKPAYDDFVSFQPKPSDRSFQAHIFAPSFIPKPFFHFFQQLNACMPVCFYFLSPCQLFWSDLLTDSGSSRTLMRLQNQGVSSAQLNDLEEYLRDRNPLLANFGRMGREMAARIEETHSETWETYGLAKQAASLPQYEGHLQDNLIVEERNTELTLLQAIQADILLLRTPREEEKIPIDADDFSVAVHAAPTRFREVEAIHDALMRLFHEKDLSPGDVLVLAPDIAEYEPYVRAVFQEQEDVLPFQLTEGSTCSQESLVKGFMRLLELPQTRWETSTVLQLADCPAFQKKHNLTDEDLRTLRNWTLDAKIRWGENALHRNELLARDHCDRPMVEESGAGTWEHGLDRILAGLVLTAQEGSDFPITPLYDLESTKAELLGRWVQLLRSIREHTTALADGTQKTVQEWGDYLMQLLEGYFFVDYTKSDAIEDEQAIRSAIQMLERAADRISEATFPFPSLYYHLKKDLEKPEKSRTESQLNAIRFCSLLPMRAIPARVIVLMGMQESFPRREEALSLNLLKNEKEADYWPSQLDFDRSLFLDAILSARESLIISHTGENEPSLLVTELLRYIDSAYTLSNNLYFKHPFYSYAPEYFFEDSTLPSFSQMRYATAQAHIQPKQKAHAFIPEFAWPEAVQGGIESIDLKQLASFAKDPVKSYLNKSLSMYLSDKKTPKELAKEEFQLSRMEAAKLRKAALERSGDLLLSEYEKQGRLPLGFFKEMAKASLSNEIEEFYGHIQSFGLTLEDLFSITLCPHTTELSKEEGNWRVPALSLELSNGKMIQLVGTLPYACKQGLLCLERGNNEGIAKIWPHYLVFLCLQLPLGKEILCVKDGKRFDKSLTNPQMHLQAYLAYYFAGLQMPSLLIPTWVDTLLTKTPEAAADKMKKDLEGKSYHFYHDYVRWAMLQPPLEHVETWKEFAYTLFSPLLEDPK